jgi:hypothetical protein
MYAKPADKYHVTSAQCVSIESDLRRILYLMYVQHRGEPFLPPTWFDLPNPFILQAINAQEEFLGLKSAED